MQTENNRYWNHNIIFFKPQNRKLNHRIRVEKLCLLRTKTNNFMFFKQFF